MINMLIVDDHPMVLEGTKRLFKDEDDFVVDTSEDIYAIHQMLENNEKFYDVYLIDINMPNQNGIVLCSKVRSCQPSAKVILYTGDQIEDYYSLVLDKLVHGLLSKTASKDQVIYTIRGILKDILALPSNFVDYVKDYYLNSENEEPLKLNSREKQILSYVALGYSNSLIADELQLSQRTIERNLSQILILLNVSSRYEAVIAAKERNLI